ncbi:unnamed protein product, partial [Ectocarpus sp. 6 AP-2014]
MPLGAEYKNQSSTNLANAGKVDDNSKTFKYTIVLQQQQKQQRLTMKAVTFEPLGSERPAGNLAAHQARPAWWGTALTSCPSAVLGSDWPVGHS